MASTKSKQEHRRVRLCGKTRTDYRQRVPWLSTEGRWLMEAGFQIGDYVEIEIHHNKLILKNRGRDGHTAD